MKRTIREALEYTQQQIKNPSAIGPAIAVIMLKEIIKELDAGKTIDDTIEFE